ncbi:MAG: hypothetical protein C4547_10920 [Phycisphaerales bacterium]|nr:MAG: hypothetical protein C4547_10920 [Phycisphaerales bacterium]
MLDRVISRDDLHALIDGLALQRRLIGPVVRKAPECRPPWRYFYQPVDRAEQLDLSFSYCVYSPKPFLFPPQETLFQFERVDGGFTARPQLADRPTALVGVHPCDLNAIQLLDHVFSAAPADRHYRARRDNTFIVGVDCARPCTDGVFCADLDSHEAHGGFDVMLYPLDGDAESAGTTPGRYGVVFGSRAGGEWVRYGRRGEVPTAADERTFDRYQRQKRTAFPHALKTPADELPQLLERSYDSLLWEATARRCYSCGSCNLVCPTCYCFDIKDQTTLGGDGGQRRRQWDGCQLRGFAQVAGGHNFRSRPAARLRHRIYRKAKWIRERTGLRGCVGCARCDRACTARINTVEIYNQLTEEV